MKIKTAYKQSHVVFISVLIVVFLSVWAGLRYVQAPLATTPSLETIVVPSTPGAELQWPNYGQSAIATTAYGVIESHGQTNPQPTASTAKLITMLAIVKQRPFDDKKGATMTFNQNDVERYNEYVAGGGSVVPVYSGLQWTQYQATEAVLLASANNVADSMAIWAFGSLEQYRHYAQAMVWELGMNDTTIGIDASGYSASTTSTAYDLALLATAVLKEPVLRSIVATAATSLPGVGDIANTNSYLMRGDIIGLKTGYIPQAGGVFVLAGTQEINGNTQEIITVVMGSPSSSSQMAQDAAVSLFTAAKNNFTYTTVIAKDEQVGTYSSAWQSNQAIITADQSYGLFLWRGEVPAVTNDAESIAPSQMGKIGSVRITYRGSYKELSTSVHAPLAAPSVWWRIVAR